MATISYVIQDFGAGQIVTWPSMSPGDDGQPAEVYFWRDHSIQLVGTFTGSASIQVSNDGTNWSQLYSQQGNTVQDFGFASRYIRPMVTSSTGGTVILFNKNRD